MSQTDTLHKSIVTEYYPRVDTQDTLVSQIFGSLIRLFSSHSEKPTWPLVATMSKTSRLISA